MRVLGKNTQPFWYATYGDVTELLDENGNYTGEYTRTYTPLVQAKWNVRTVSSGSEVEMFGVHAFDTIVFIAPRTGFPLTETSVLWYGITPELDQDGKTETPFNYRVVGIRSSLNFVRCYAQKVDVSVPVKPEPETTMPTPPVEGDVE